MDDPSHEKLPAHGPNQSDTSKQIDDKDLLNDISKNQKISIPGRYEQEDKRKNERPPLTCFESEDLFSDKSEDLFSDKSEDESEGEDEDEPKYQSASKMDSEMMEGDSGSSDFEESWGRGDVNQMGAASIEANTAGDLLEQSSSDDAQFNQNEDFANNITNDLIEATNEPSFQLL